MQLLLGSFVRAAVAARATAPAADVEAAGIDVLRRWGEPRRGYHDVEHLAEVLERLGELGCHDPGVVLAAWFHDAVYDGRPGSDEQASADLARRELAALGVPAPFAGRVAELVLVTSTHDPPPGDPGAAALCDADLAVLAADDDRYARYVAGVRHEYAHVDGDAFAAGRTAVLRRLLDRPALFTTDVGAQRWEPRARANLRRELDGLQQRPPRDGGG